MTSFNFVQKYKIGIFLFIDSLRNILVTESASLVIFYVLFSLIFGWILNEHYVQKYCEKNGYLPGILSRTDRANEVNKP